jgi:16S rRNA (cytosine1402-N4)-methyltransferase
VGLDGAGARGAAGSAKWLSADAIAGDRPGVHERPAREATGRRAAGRHMSAPQAARHIPVLVRGVIAGLAPRPDGLTIDATFGAGGYAAAILAAGGRVLAIDRDPTAIAAGAAQAVAAGGRLTLAEGRFGALDRIAAERGIAAADGVVLDLGVSSMQLDTAARGFSFRNDGPLDMRMGGTGPSAADVVARASERDLADIIFTLGEERHARAVARAIVAARAERAIDSTLVLATIVGRVVRARPGDIHPATRTFQALRLFVNEELAELAAALAAAERILAPGGRLAVVSFHSLEDRMVKTFLRSRGEPQAGSRHLPLAATAPATFRGLGRRPVTPDEAEVRANPRARSAKLRVAERTAAPPRDEAPLLPPLPALAAMAGGS